MGDPGEPGDGSRSGEREGGKGGRNVGAAAKCRAGQHRGARVPESLFSRPPVEASLPIEKLDSANATRQTVEQSIQKRKDSMAVSHNLIKFLERDENLLVANNILNHFSNGLVMHLQTSPNTTHDPARKKKKTDEQEPKPIPDADGPKLLVDDLFDAIKAQPLPPHPVHYELPAEVLMSLKNEIDRLDSPFTQTFDLSPPAKMPKSKPKRKTKRKHDRLETPTESIISAIKSFRVRRAWKISLQQPPKTRSFRIGRSPWTPLVTLDWRKS